MLKNNDIINLDINQSICINAKPGVNLKQSGNSQQRIVRGVVMRNKNTWTNEQSKVIHKIESDISDLKTDISELKIAVKKNSIGINKILSHFNI